MSVLVGVDIGGSGLRCRAEVDGVARPTTSASRVRITAAGIDTDALIDSVVPRSRRGTPTCSSGHARPLALADPVHLMAALRERVGAGRTALVGDALAAMVGAVGGVRPGAVVAAGSGAVAFATDFDTVWRRIDGWGHVLGDRGSSAWVGLRALETALQAYDGVDDAGAALLVAMTDRLGDPESRPRHVMTRPDAVEVVAALAPGVTALAATDPEAARICREAGSARPLAGRGRRRHPGRRLSSTGGLFLADPVREAFAVEAARLGLEVHPAVGSNLDGALHLARHLDAGGAGRHDGLRHAGLSALRCLSRPQSSPSSPTTTCSRSAASCWRSCGVRALRTSPSTTSDSWIAAENISHPDCVRVTRTRVRLSGSVARETSPRPVIRSSRWVIDDGAIPAASASWVGVMAAPSGQVASRESTAHSPWLRPRSTSWRSYHRPRRLCRPWIAVTTRWTVSSPPAAT